MDFGLKAQIDQSLAIPWKSPIQILYLLAWKKKIEYKITTPTFEEMWIDMNNR